MEYTRGNIKFLQGDVQWLDMLRPLLGKISTFIKGRRTVIGIYDQWALKFYPLTNAVMISSFHNDMMLSHAATMTNLSCETLCDLPCILPCHAFFQINGGLAGMFHPSVNYHESFIGEDVCYGLKIMHRHVNAMPLDTYIEKCIEYGELTYLGEELKFITCLVLATLHNLHMIHPEKAINDLHKSNVLVSSCRFSEKGDYIMHSNANVEWAKKPTYLRLLTGAVETQSHTYLRIFPVRNGLRVSFSDFDECTNSPMFIATHVSTVTHALMGITPDTHSMGPTKDKHLFLNSLYIYMHTKYRDFLDSKNASHQRICSIAMEYMKFAEYAVHPSALGFGVPLEENRIVKTGKIMDPQCLNLVEARLSGFARRLKPTFRGQGVTGILGAAGLMRHLSDLHTEMEDECRNKDLDETRKTQIKLIVSTVMNLSDKEKKLLEEGINQRSLAVFAFEPDEYIMQSIYNMLKHEYFKNVLAHEETTYDMMFNGMKNGMGGSKLFFWIHLDVNQHGFRPDPYTSQHEMGQ